MTLELPPMSRNAAAARAHIERYGDQARAVEVSNELTIAALKQFNDAKTDVATSLLARAMFAQAMMTVAADWMTEITKMPTPDTYRAILDIAVYRPLDVEAHSYKDDTL